jgi:sugar-specific transcriptional regulator TrmB
MDDVSSEHQLLEELGLSTLEAEVYLALLVAGTTGAAAIAESSGRPRSSIYLALRLLTDRGLVEGGSGYGGKFRASPPGGALAALMQHERELLEQRQEVVEKIEPRLERIAERSLGEAAEDVIEVLRSRRASGERFERLQLEAEHEIDVFVKAPAISTRPGNPAEIRALKRGVRNRGLYEEEVLALPEVKPHLERWQKAGEEIRVYPGELPLKMALVDRRAALLPLPTSEGRDGLTALLIRHPALGQALHMLFEHLWEQSQPLEVDEGRTKARRTAAAR